MSTLIGIVLGVVLLGAAVWMSGGVAAYLDPHALMIVAGGTLAATLISFDLRAVLNLFRLTIRLFRENHSMDLELAVERLVELSNQATEKTIYALEGEGASETNAYIKIGIGLLVKDVTTQRIARRFAIEMDGVRARHQMGIRMFSVMSKVAPSFGLVGTLIGLVSMLRSISSEISPETLGPSMALAMIATLYGALLSFLLFLPASEKLRSASMQELTHITLVRDGILMLRDGYAPRELEQMLNAYLPRTKRTSVMDRLKLKSSSDVTGARSAKGRG